MTTVAQTRYIRSISWLGVYIYKEKVKSKKMQSQSRMSAYPDQFNSFPSKNPKPKCKMCENAQCLTRVAPARSVDDDAHQAAGDDAGDGEGNEPAHVDP